MGTLMGIVVSWYLTMESTLKHQMFFNQVLDLLVLLNIWIQQRCAVIISKVIQRFPGGIF